MGNVHAEFKVRQLHYLDALAAVMMDCLNNLFDQRNPRNLS